MYLEEYVQLKFFLTEFTSEYIYCIYVYIFQKDRVCLKEIFIM